MQSWSRRHFLRGALGTGGAVAAMGLMAACAGAPAASPTSPPTAPPAVQPTATAAPTTASTATSAPAAGATATPQPAPITATLTPTKFAMNNAKITAWAWQSFSPAADKWIAAQSTAWGQANGGTVEYDVVDNSVFTQKLSAAIEAKTVPDVIMLSTVLYYQGLNILVDLTDEYNKLNKLADGFYKSLLPGIQVDNKIWSLPIETGPSPLFTRLDLIQQATGQRQPPKTLDELESIATKLNKPPGFYGIGWTVGRTPDGNGNTLDVMFQDGGYLVSKDGTKPTILSDGTIAALTRIKRWWDEKLIPPDSVSWDDTGNNSAYQSKRVAFVDNPASIYAWLVANDQQLLADTSMAPIPAGKAGSFSSGAGGWSWSVYNGSKSQDAAIALIDFLLQPDNLELQCEQIGGRWYPPYQELATRAYWKSKPQFDYYPQLINNAIYESYPAPPTPNVMAALGEADTALAIADMVQAVIVTGTDPQKAATDTQAQYEAIFKKYKLG